MLESDTALVLGLIKSEKNCEGLSTQIWRILRASGAKRCHVIIEVRRLLARNYLSDHILLVLEP